MRSHTSRFLAGSLLVFANLFIFLPSYAISPERASELVAEQETNPNFNCINFTDEEKEFFLDYLRKQHAQPGSNYETFREDLFLQLGDEQTIKRFLDRLHQWKQPWASRELSKLQDSGQARVIEEISDLLFREEGFQYFGTDSLVPPASFEVASAMLKIVGDSPQLAPEVRHWAAGVKALYNHDKENREIMRKWYRQNEAFFKSHDYRAVQPPLEKSVNSSSIETPSNRASAPISPSHTDDIRMRESLGNVYAWVAGLLLAICVGLVWLLRRKNT